MAVVNDFHCATHGYFESRTPKCPMKGCTHEVLQVFLQAPALVSQKTKATDKSVKQLAIEFGMSNIKSTRTGENQAGFLTRNNKFSEKEYAEAEKFATRKKGVNKDKIKPVNPPPTPQAKETRAGDNAIWGGAFQGMNMQSILAGRYSQPVNGESAGLTPSQAGIKVGPTVNPNGSMRDHENLQIKK